LGGKGVARGSDNGSGLEPVSVHSDGLCQQASPLVVYVVPSQDEHHKALRAAGHHFQQGPEAVGR
jgi:hypothetical protein